MSDDYTYVGTELDLFANARNWKAYVRGVIAPDLKGDVLEVGAGLGGTTRVFWDREVSSWTCLEPDAGLASRLRDAVRDWPGGPAPEVRVGTIADLEPGRTFDAILYIDVIEHIEHDRDELERAAARLSPGGRVIVLSPAHQALYTPFDRAIGHYRRYSKRMIRDLRPRGLALERAFYLDSMGMLLSLGNRLLLRQSSPNPSQIWLWDRVFVPCSRVVDRLTFRQLGKSIVAVWRPEQSPGPSRTARRRQSPREASRPA